MITGLHNQKAYTHTGTSTQIPMLSAHAFCLRIAMSVCLLGM